MTKTIAGLLTSGERLGTRQRRSLLGLAALLGALAVVFMTVLGNSRPAGAEHNAPAFEVFTRGGFEDQVRGFLFQRLQGTSQLRPVSVSDASDLIVLKLTLPPHSAVPWHTHPGPALVAVAEGTITITYAGECTPREYSQGQAFLDGGQLTHRADNFGGVDDVVVYVTFLGIPEGSGPTILAPAGFDSGC